MSCVAWTDYSSLRLATTCVFVAGTGHAAEGRMGSLSDIVFTVGGM